jgi:hypothetical protein
MLRLEGVTAGAKIRGVAGPVAVEVVRAEWIGSDALNVVYRGADGPAEIVLFWDSEPRLELLQATRAFGFDGDADAFKIASEAQRIRLAYLFDPYLAVHSSKIDPLLDRCLARERQSAVDHSEAMAALVRRRHAARLHARSLDPTFVGPLLFALVLTAPHPERLLRVLGHDFAP